MIQSVEPYMGKVLLHHRQILPLYINKNLSILLLQGYIFYKRYMTMAQITFGQTHEHNRLGSSSCGAALTSLQFGFHPLKQYDGVLKFL